MSEELLKDEVLEQDNKMEDVIENSVAEELTAAVNVGATLVKKGLATGALVCGILSVVFMLLFINYILAIIALILGIVYLVKKGEKKVRAIVGVVLASVSIIASSVIWGSVYHYITTTDLMTMMDDLKTVTGGKVDVKDTMEATIKEYVGEDFDIAQIETFVGGSLSYETMKEFVGDTSAEEIQEFINNFDYAAIEKDLGEGFTYEDVVEKLGEGFTFEDLKAYMESLK